MRARGANIQHAATKITNMAYGIHWLRLLLLNELNSNFIDIVIRFLRKDFNFCEGHKLTRNCGGGIIKITVLFQNMLVPQNDILEIPKKQ